MTQRADYIALAPKAMQILMSQEAYLQAQFSVAETLSIPLWELVKLRVSQINQCAFCIDMHSQSALKMGETAERLLGLSAWRDMPLYSTREAAALAWAEHLTAGNSVSDDMYAQVVGTFGEQGLVDLTVAINAINSWNRIAKTFKPEVGSYKP
ncbi:carboxymuconolactone decarboxylase family protein [Thalassolituus sp. LLYu03]|uniref:carboxymuconolactone decarboxylase family protein n=1 Tax=Thalassolituus sp. LLYu03 TaxID=3421656 RepID=UPI003D2B68CD